MGFLAMFTFQLDQDMYKHCQHPIAVMGVVDLFGHCSLSSCKIFSLNTKNNKNMWFNNNRLCAKLETSFVQID